MYSLASCLQRANFSWIVNSSRSRSIRQRENCSKPVHDDQACRVLLRHAQLAIFASSQARTRACSGIQKRFILDALSLRVLSGLDAFRSAPRKLMAAFSLSPWGMSYSVQRLRRVARAAGARRFRLGIEMARGPRRRAGQAGASQC